MPKFLYLVMLSGCALFTNPLSSAMSEEPVQITWFDDWHVLARYEPSGWRQEWLVTPTGVKIAGAPFGLKCALSYRCLVQSLIRLNDVMYLVGDSQLYRYDEASETFELLLDVDELHFGPGTPEAVYAIWSAHHHQTVGTLFFEGGWHITWHATSL